MREPDAEIVIRNVTPADTPVWEAMRRELWPEGAEEHAEEIEMFFAGELEEPVAVLLAESADGEAIAVVELSIRTDVAGLEGQRAGYIEGLYVKPEARGEGVSRKLLRASHEWAHRQNCPASRAIDPTAWSSTRASRLTRSSSDLPRLICRR